MSIYCSHRRNKLLLDNDGSVYCPVHNSLFDLSGKPFTGPANKPLTWYLTHVDDAGAITVDPSKTVRHGAWAALPDWAAPRKL